MDASEFDMGGASAPPDKLDALQKLLKEAVDLSSTAASLEADLKAAKSALHALTTNRLPDMMTELQMDAAEFAGWKVKIHDFVSGSLPKDEEKRAKAIRWLEEHDGGELVKTSVSLDFAKSQHNEAMSIAGEMEEKGFAPTVKSDVHASTLASYARQRIKDGDDIDAEVLGLYLGKVAKIKAPS
jgi:hypothetical protein